jgi:hypothetical protein
MRSHTLWNVGVRFTRVGPSPIYLWVCIFSVTFFHSKVLDLDGAILHELFDPM